MIAWHLIADTDLVDEFISEAPGEHMNWPWIREKQKFHAKNGKILAL